MSYKIMIGTPMYGGFCTADYTESILELGQELWKAGHQLLPGFLSNESLIPRGRNTIAWHFLSHHDATHLLFIDADIRFRVKDIMKMIETDLSLIIGPTPLKGLNWENIRKAALNNEPNLSQFSGYFSVNLLPNHKMVDSNVPFEIEHGATALMLIKREVFEQLIPYTDYYVNGGHSIPQNAKVYNFFQVNIEKNKQHLLSEDYFFCQSYRNIGGKVWAAPWCEIGHLGSYIFNGKFSSVN